VSQSLFSLSNIEPLCISGSRCPNSEGKRNYEDHLWLMKVTDYHLDDRDYDCRAKWMAVAALARQ